MHLETTVRRAIQTGDGELVEDLEDCLTRLLEHIERDDMEEPYDGWRARKRQQNADSLREALDLFSLEARR